MNQNGLYTNQNDYRARNRMPYEIAQNRNQERHAELFSALEPERENWDLPPMYHEARPRSAAPDRSMLVLTAVMTLFLISSGLAVMFVER